MLLAIPATILAIAGLLAASSMAEKRLLAEAAALEDGQLTSQS
jgi:hypothetical protein